MLKYSLKMFLFYSDGCNHCTMLLETLKTLDKQHRIKLINIDYLKSNNIIFDSRITHVPAMLLKEYNKIIFGKEVFDYLLLPGKGVLLTEGTKGPVGTEGSIETKNNDEPSGVDSYISQSYENINDMDDYITGPVTIWENLDSKSNVAIQPIKPIGNTDTSREHKQLPSLAEIQKMRESALH